MSARLTILGPNLHGLKGTFHVHGAGCADIKKRQYSGAEQWTAEFDSLQALVEDVYDGQLQDNAGDPAGWGEWEAYASEFKLFPCVQGLPEKV